MAGNISITKAEGTWVVRAGGAVLGESTDALRLEEDGYPFVIYFPRGDIAMAFLDDSNTTTTCPHKGQARYYSIQTKSVTLADAAFSYDDPIKDVSDIAGHIAFLHEGVTVERV